MKAVISVVLGMGITCGAIAVYLVTTDCCTESVEPASIDAAALAKLDERIASLDAPLQRLAELEDEVATLEGAPQSVVAAPDSSASKTLRKRRRNARNAAPALDVILADSTKREQFRTFVNGSIERARGQRRTNDTRVRKEKAARVEELSQGPYGRWNYRVNSLAEKLSLDGRQKGVYHDLLVKYDGQRQDFSARVKEQFSQTRAAAGEENNRKFFVGVQVREQFKQMGAQLDAIGAEFDREFSGHLGPEQQKTYADLPDHERGGVGKEYAVFASGDDVGGRRVMRAVVGEMMEGFAVEGKTTTTAIRVERDASGKVELILVPGSENAPPKTATSSGSDR